MITLFTLIRDDLSASFSEKGFQKSRIMVLSMLTRLRQFCCDPRLIYDNYQGSSAKLEACMELVESCIAAIDARHESASH